VTEELSAKLGITPGHTTPDGMFTLMEVECLGACDRAPVLMINDDGWHERLTPEQVSQFVDDLADARVLGADRVSSARGEEMRLATKATKAIEDHEDKKPIVVFFVIFDRLRALRG
jgi:(2Fe-2S) ferredoxin